MRRPQDGAFFKGPPYPGYPFLMIPDLSSPYLSNGPLSPGGARTVSACPAAPGRVGGRDDGMRPLARRWCGGWGRPGRIPGRTCFGAELFCGGRAVGCAGQCLDESKVPLHFPLLLGRGFGVHLWGSFLASKISLLAVKENLDLCRLFFGAGGGGGLAFLPGNPSAFPGGWAVGRGSWVGDVAPDFSFTERLRVGS